MTTVTPDSLSLEETLKAEGNALFVGKKFDEAIEKYSKAIAINNSNAILYANRAACYVNIQSFGKAAQDGMKATELDPSYYKAWGRLAKSYHALQSYEMATEAWKRAVATLPTDNPSEKDKQFRRDFNKGLKESQRLSDNNVSNIISFSVGGHIRDPVRDRHKTPPWHCASWVIPRLEERGITESSAYVIFEAYENFKKGVDMLGRGKAASIEALTCITDGILQDYRCFWFLQHDFEDNMWQTNESTYGNIIQFAVEKSRAPRFAGNPEELHAAFHDLHREGGHDVSRPAFSVGVRAMLYQAQLQLFINSNPLMTFGICDELIKLLHWGQQEWQNAPKEKRGEFLEPTFLNGVHRVRLEAYMMVYRQNNTSPDFTLEGLLQHANTLLTEVRLHPPSSSQPGFNLAFGRYLEGYAVQVQGFYWSAVARGKTYKTAEDVREGRALFRKSAEHYFTASSKFPEDDEDFTRYLRLGLEELFTAGAPLRETLPLMERLRYAVPLTHEIWQFSVGNLRALWQMHKNIENQVEIPSRVKLSRGELTLDDAVSTIISDPKKVFGDLAG